MGHGIGDQRRNQIVAIALGSRRAVTDRASLRTAALPHLVFGVTAVKHDNPCAFTVGRLPKLTNAAIWTG